MVNPTPADGQLPPPPLMAPPPAPSTIAPPPPYGMPTQARPLVRVRALGLAVQGCLAVVIAVSLFSAWTTWNRRALLVDVRDGSTSLTPSRADEVDGLVQLGGVLTLLMLIVTAVLWVIWFQRAYKNVATVHYVDHGAGWAIGAWFVPFLNLVRPFQIAREIVVETPSPRLAKTPALLGWWWALWILSNLAARFGFNANPDSLDSLITTDTLATVSEVVYAAAAVLAVMVVRHITAAQVARFGTSVT